MAAGTGNLKHEVVKFELTQNVGECLKLKLESQQKHDTVRTRGNIMKK